MARPSSPALPAWRDEMRPPRKAATQAAAAIRGDVSFENRARAPGGENTGEYFVELRRGVAADEPGLQRVLPFVAQRPVFELGLARVLHGRRLHVDRRREL